MTGAMEPTEAVLRHLLEGELDALAIGASTGLDTTALARWAADPAHATLIAALARLADARAQLVVSRYRVAAAATLVHIATGGEGTELARRACVDLLKIDLPRVAPTTDASGWAAPPPDTDAILAALEHLGAAADG